METGLLECGFAPLTSETLAEFFEVEEETVRRYLEFFSKLFYLYKATGDSTYLALSMLPDVEGVRRRVDKEFAEFISSVNNSTVFEFSFLTQDPVRGDAFTDMVRRKAREKGKEVLITKSRENNYWQYSVIVIPSAPDIEVLDIDEFDI